MKWLLVVVAVSGCGVLDEDDDYSIYQEVRVDAGSAGVLGEVAFYVGTAESFSLPAIPPETPETAGMPAPSDFAVILLGGLTAVVPQLLTPDAVEDWSSDSGDAYWAAAVGYRNNTAVGVGIALDAYVSDESIDRAAITLASDATYELWGTREPQCLRFVAPDKPTYFIYSDGCD